MLTPYQGQTPWSPSTPPTYSGGAGTYGPSSSPSPTTTVMYAPAQPHQTPASHVKSSSKYYGSYLVEKATRDEQQKRIDLLEAEVARLRHELREERDSHKNMLMELARNNTHTSQRHLQMLEGFHKDATVAQQGHVRSMNSHNQQLGFLLLNQLHQQQNAVEHVAIKNSMALLPPCMMTLTRRSVMEQAQRALPAPKDESERSAAVTEALVADLNANVGMSPENGMKQMLLLDAQIKDCSKYIDEAKRTVTNQSAPHAADREVVHKFQETVQEAEDILQALVVKRGLLSDGLRRMMGGGGSGGGSSSSSASTALSIRLVP